jgi:hypothetical protein
MINYLSQGQIYLFFYPMPLSVKFFGTHRENRVKTSVTPNKLKLFNVEAEMENENIMKNSLSASTLFFWEHSCHKWEITK